MVVVVYKQTVDFAQYILKKRCTMRKNKSNKSNKISKKLIVAAIISTLVFMTVSATVFCTLFYRRSDTYELMFPDLVGSYEQDIKADARFNIEKNYVYSDIYPKGVVISQSPSGLSAQKIPNGRIPTLTLNISLGKESFAMPDLSGKSLAEAQLIIRGMQCGARIVKVYDDSGENISESVIRSYPDADQTVFIGDEIILYVRAPRGVQRIMLPDFIGNKVEHAIGVLSGLGVGYEITEGFDPNAVEGEVISQTPAPNIYIDKNTTVIITVNSE